MFEFSIITSKGYKIMSRVSKLIDDYFEKLESKEKTKKFNTEDFLLDTKNRVIYQTTSYFLPQIYDMIKVRKLITLRPDYQRRLRWNNSKKSLLIESFLLNLPIPPIYLFETDRAKFEVMDGQQRLATIQEFYEDKFKLIGLKSLFDINGKNYSEISPLVKSVFDRATVSTTVVLMESDQEIPIENAFENPELKRVIFERLNTGGENLNPQEIRNALNPGKFNNLISSLTRHKNFTEVFKIPPFLGEPESTARQNHHLVKTMKDCELILRFFALRDDSNVYGSLRSILDRAMAKTRISNDNQINELREIFCSRFDFLYELFDHQPFVLENRVATVLYDALMVAIDKLWKDKDKIMKNKMKVNRCFNNLLSTKESFDEIIGSKGSAKDINNRIELFMQVLNTEKSI